jgi:hypothetical protein
MKNLKDLIRNRTREFQVCRATALQHNTEDRIYLTEHLNGWHFVCKVGTYTLYEFCVQMRFF